MYQRTQGITSRAPATMSQQWRPPKWKKASAEPAATRAKSIAADPRKRTMVMKARATDWLWLRLP